MGLIATPDREARTRAQRNCDRSAALHRVYRLARVLEAGMQQLDRGIYQIQPGDVLALRTALDRAEMVITQEERSST
jgi:hypothetical protein